MKKKFKSNPLRRENVCVCMSVWKNYFHFQDPNIETGRNTAREKILYFR